MNHDRSVGFGVYARMTGLAAVALLTALTAPTFLSDYAREHRDGGAPASTAVILATWGLVALVALVSALCATAMLRDARRIARGTDLVFESKPMGVLGEGCFAVIGAALGWFGAIVFVSIPIVSDPAPHGPRGDSVIGNLVISCVLGLPALALLLVRPAYTVDPARRAIERLRLASWIPWRKAMPYDLRVGARVWTFQPGGRGVPIPAWWAVTAHFENGREFVLERLPLGTPEHVIDDARRAWETRLGIAPAYTPPQPSAPPPGVHHAYAPTASC